MKKETYITNENTDKNFIFENTNFEIHLAEHKTVHNEWTFKWSSDIYQIHNHRIYLIEEGSALVTLKTGRNETVELMPGHMYFFPAFSIEKTNCPSFCRQAYVHFSSDNLYLNAISYIPESFDVEIKNPEEFKMLLSLRNIIEKEYTNNSQESMLKSDGCLRILISYFFRKFEDMDPRFFKFYDILEYIKNNLKNKITVKDLAAMKNLNTVYFSNLFTKQFGISVKEYLINARITMAQKLIMQSELNIMEICYSVGFQTESYFIKKFTQIIGLTPMQYRKQM